MLHTKRGTGLTALVLGALYLILFLIHYFISVSEIDDLGVEITSYIIYLIVCALTAASAYVFHVKKAEGRGAYLDFLLLLAMRFFYQMPYYTVYYIADAYTTLDATVLGLLMGLWDIVLCYGVFALLSLLLDRLGASGEGGALWCSLLFPLYEFLLLVIEIVLYLLQNRGTIFTSDIAYFVFGFIYPALMFGASYALTLPLAKLFTTPSQKGE